MKKNSTPKSDAEAGNALLIAQAVAEKAVKQEKAAKARAHSAKLKFKAARKTYKASKKAAKKAAKLAKCARKDLEALQAKQVAAHNNPKKAPAAKPSAARRRRRTPQLPKSATALPAPPQSAISVSEPQG